MLFTANLYCAVVLIASRNKNFYSVELFKKNHSKYKNEIKANKIKANKIK